MYERSFFGAFAFSGAVAIAVALWAFSLLKEKNTAAAELLKSKNDLANLAAQHQEEFADLTRDHQQQLLALDEQWQRNLDELKARQADRLRDAYAQFNQIVGEGNQALVYINQLESKLRQGGEATDVEIEKLAATASALSILSQQYQAPMGDFAQLGNVFSERAAAVPDAPDKRLGFIKRIFSRNYRNQEKAYQQDLGRQSAYQEAHAQFSNVYAQTQKQMASVSGRLRSQAEALYSLADQKKATLEDLQQFFDTSRQTLNFHEEMLEFEPEIDIQDDIPLP